jgi:FkbM family methyltransferase
VEHKVTGNKIHVASDRLSIHHVGGRSGSRGFPILSHFEHLITSVMYDADIDCIQQIIQRSKNHEKKTIVAPFAISDKKEITNLYMTYDPNMSSLLKPKTDIKLSYSYPNSNFDYDVAQALKVVEVRELEVTSLDDFFISNPEIPKPFFLSLDTQGSELKILNGSKVTLDNVVAVLVEVAFDEMYENQPLFGEIHEFLNMSGFKLMDIYKGVPTTNSRGPVGIRGRGQLSWGDALFFKDPQIADRTLLAFCALAFGYADFARNCIPFHNYINPTLEIMLKEFEQIVIKSSNKLPPTFADVYTESQSKNRYKIDSLDPELNKIKKIKGMIKKKEKYFKIPLNAYFYSQNVILKIRKLRDRVNKRISIIKSLKFAKKYGFDILRDELLRSTRN